MPQRTNRSAAPPHIGGFTLIELLVVISIIGILTALTIPIVNKVRTASHTANTQALLSQLSGACDRYYSDFHAYPGPFSNDQIYNSNAGTAAIAGGSVDPHGSTTVFNNGASPTINVTLPAAVTGGYDTTQINFKQISMSENLVLGLVGGLRPDTTNTPPNLVYDPTTVGNGPMSLNLNQPTRYAPYTDTKDLSWTTFVDTGGHTLQTGHFSDYTDANDTVIPEFLDRYPDRMPILYMRAKVGATGAGAPPYTETNNPVIIDDLTNPTTLRVSQYTLSQIASYTQSFQGGSWPGSMTIDSTTPVAGGSKSIGTGKSSRGYYYNGTPAAVITSYHGLRTVTKNLIASGEKTPANATLKYQYPYDAYPYFLNDPSSNQPKARDSYILISAGPDSTYGTTDDITSFGSVTPGQ